MQARASASLRAVDSRAKAPSLLTAAQVQHEPWRATEEKLILGRWREEGATLEVIAARLRKDPAWVSLRLKIYEDAIVGPLVLDGSLLVSTAQELVAIRDEDVRRDLTAKAVAEGWSKSDARREVKAVTLTRQLRDVAARAKELLDLLSQVDASRLPSQAQEDLRDLSRRINILARGEKPVLPSVEGAMRAAGLNPERESRRPTSRRGLKPKKTKSGS